MKKWYVTLVILLALLGMGLVSSILLFPLHDAAHGTDFLEISVIVRQSDSAVWSAARQGMEQAAEDYYAQIRFLTLTNSNDLDAQQALIVREREDGADGIVLAPVDPASQSALIFEITQQIPVVTLESAMAESGASACISVDDVALGTAIGNAALNGVAPGETVLLIDNAPLATGITLRVSAAFDLLTAKGRNPVRWTPSGNLPIAEELAITLIEGDYRAVLAFEPEVLELAADVVPHLPSPCHLYGMGATGAIASHLEQGTITSIVAQNEFAAGYLTIQSLVQAIHGERFEAPEPLDFHVIRREDMYDPASQELLFPVSD